MREDALLDIGGEEVLPEGAAALRELGVEAVVWACTSGSFVFGWDGASSQVDDLRRVAGVPASSTSFAFVNAARHLGLRNVAVAAICPKDVADRFADFLAAVGTTVISLSCKGIVTAAEAGELGRGARHRTAHGRLAAGTRTAPGKPVLTANQVSVWREGLRLAGDTEPRPGLGVLFT